MRSTLTSEFERIFRESPGRIAMLVRLADSVRRVSRGELHGMAMGLARWLASRGIRKGDRVGLALENGPEWGASYFGILMAGGIAVPIDPQSGADEINIALTRTRSRAFIASGRIPLGELRLPEYVIISGEPADLQLRAPRLPEIMASREGGEHLPPAAPDDPASIIFTSGTTGPPKAAVLTHANFLSNVESLSSLGYLTHEDNFLSILPLHHAFPFLVTLVLPLLSGALITYLSPLKADLLMKCILEQRVTIFVVTPQVLALIHKAVRERLEKVPRILRGILSLSLHLSRVAERATGLNPSRPFQRRMRSAVGDRFRYFVCGGARLDPRIARDFLAWGFTVLEGYGLTETSPVAAMNTPGSARIGSVGASIGGVEIAIDRPDERGVGEVLIRGPNVMRGYFEDEAATREAIRDGWFHTGDLGRLDRRGRLTIEGRLKDVIVLSSGKKVSAEEIEARYASGPSVKELCVFADPADEKVVAAVVPDLDYFRRAGESNVRDRVRWDLEYLSERLAPYQRLKDFVIVDELPKTRLGKVKREQARALYMARAARPRAKRAPGAAPSPSPVGEKVLSVLECETGARAISSNDRLELDLGIDSLGRVSLMAALERACGITIREDEFLPLLTVGEVIACVERALGEGAPATEAGARSWGEIMRAEPPPSVMKCISLEAGPLSRLVTLSVSLVMDVTCRLYFRMRVKGRERLGAGPFIICPNHASYLDGFVVFSALPFTMRHRLFFIGLREYFEVPVIRGMLRSLRIIPVDPARNIIETLQASAFVIRHGKILCAFPEGARSIKGELKEFKKGVAILSKEAGVQIIPAAIVGSHRAWKPGSRFPKPCRIEISFGAPLSFEEMLARGRALSVRGDEYEVASAGLRAAVLDLMTTAHQPL